MLVVRAALPGVLVLEPRVFGDARGWFFEGWNEQAYREAGVVVSFRQDNYSRSTRGVLRGLHFQNPRPQAKLVTCLEGAIHDVVVDLRVGSPTFGRFESFDLDGDRMRQLFVPHGFAHGFQVVSERALVAYKCDETWAPEHEAGIAADDPDLAIPWPLADRIVSEKDRKLPRLRDLPREKLFR